MFEAAACSLAALKIKFGLDGPFGTSELRNASRLHSLFRFPQTWYSKYNLYDLVDEQKKLLSIEEDDLYLEGFNREFQGQILQRLEQEDRRRHADDPWPTCQVTQEAERLLEKGYCLELREARIARDQWKAREAQYEARMQELRAMRAQERCCERERPGLRASKFPSPPSLETYPLTESLQDSLMPLKTPEDCLRGQPLKVDSIKVVAEGLSFLPIVEGHCEASFKHKEVTSYISGKSLTVDLQGDFLQEETEERNEEELLGTKASVEPKIREAMGDSPVPQSEYFCSPSSPYTDFPSQDPSIEPQDAEDEPRIDKQPVEAVVDALKVQKPPPE
ncbi:hypothetical protein PISMIDRAFT_13262 [Pisolithus microcarpus 441]|uniref:Uncharacterized protein n=1 Tax=Pisolithus microcarpus 441 TaxID=765257 RepID=A0A0C9Z162_9AGAM|nr:hypothetical protein PISMIDRAFT_13262 [Pisolithus microcarpus 441]